MTSQHPARMVSQHHPGARRPLEFERDRSAADQSKPVTTQASPARPHRGRQVEQLPKPYLLFDAGGTLVFPDQEYLIETAQIWNIHLTHQALYQGYYQLIHQLDCQARSRGHFGTPWPHGYGHAILETLGLLDTSTTALARRIWDRHQQRNLWSYTFDWVRETLSDLTKQGYRMSVLSNSDGRTEKVFQTVKLDRYFEHIFDSKKLGFEKPDSTVFEYALAMLDLQPAEVLYVGDIYQVDIVGANRANIGGIHIDPLNLYADWPGVHIIDVSHLPAWLSQPSHTHLSADLFPTKSTSTAGFCPPDPLLVAQENQPHPPSDGVTKSTQSNGC